MVVRFNGDDDDDDVIVGKRSKSVHIESNSKYNCFISHEMSSVVYSDDGWMILWDVTDASNDVMIMVYCDTCLRSVASVRMVCITVSWMVGTVIASVGSSSLLFLLLEFFNRNAIRSDIFMLLEPVT